jgi:transketolase-like protein
MDPHRCSSRVSRSRGHRKDGGQGANAEAFGWWAIEVDGHDVEEIDNAYKQVLDTDGRPVTIIARTVKGKGAAAVENHNGFHGKPARTRGTRAGQTGFASEATLGGARLAYENGGLSASIGPPTGTVCELSRIRPRQWARSHTSGRPRSPGFGQLLPG